MDLTNNMSYYLHTSCIALTYILHTVHSGENTLFKGVCSKQYVLYEEAKHVLFVYHVWFSILDVCIKSTGL